MVKVQVMGEVKVWSHNVSLAFYRLTSLSFHVNRPSHSWDMTFSKYDLDNPIQGHGRGEHWKSQHESNILLTHIPSVPSQYAIPFIRLFQNLTLKIKGQGHGWGERWKSQHGSNILSTHIPLIPCPDTFFSKFDLKNQRSRSWFR